MYCAAVFCLSRMYYSIISNPDSSLDASAKVYSHLPYVELHGSFPINHHTIWYWNTPRIRPMRGVTTHVSASKISTDWKTALKKNTDTRCSTSYLLRILVILLHTPSTSPYSGPPLTNCHPQPISLSPGLWRRSTSQGGVHKLWTSLMWPPFPPPLQTTSINRK